MLTVALFVALNQPQNALPDPWYGTWTGGLELNKPDGDGQRLKMSIEVKRLEGGKASWTIVYDDAKKKDTRAYTLLPVDGKKGRFVIDEHNGILLDAALVEDSLFSLFRVGSTLIQAEYRLIASEMEVTMSSFDASGSNPGASTEGRDPVVSHRLKTVQRARLKHQP